MAKRKKKTKIETTDYRHEGERRANIPPARIAGEGVIPAAEKVKYAYNPHLPPTLRFDPNALVDRVRELSEEAERRPLDAGEARLLRGALKQQEPWLEWAGRIEEESRGFAEVDPVALHIHERVSAQAIVQAVKREDLQRDLFADPQQAYQDAIQFYQHDIDWANRLILGDSLEVMSSLAHREDLAGKVQMVYMDPPYGIKFASNFQPEVLTRLDHGASADKDMVREPEMVRAYRDTWTLGKHSYLRYLRDRLLVARELLTDSGSLFLQINDENCHLARIILDEVFGASNFVSQIVFQTTSGFATKTLATLGDYLLWYARDADQLKVRKVFQEQPEILGEGNARWLLLEDQTYRGVSAAEKRGDAVVPAGAKPYKPDNIKSQGAASDDQAFEHQGRVYRPGGSSHWKANFPDGMRRLAGANRIHVAENSIQYRRFAGDYPYTEIGNIWTDTLTGSFTEKKRYVVQTNTKVIERCLHLTTDPGDLVLDPTCGSGTTAWCAEKWGRRWITVDTSRVTLTLARERILTAAFESFVTRDGGNNPAAGFVLNRAPHITLGHIARNVHLDPILEQHQAILAELAKECNEQLDRLTDEDRVRLAGKLKEKEEVEGKSSVTEGDRRRWLMPPLNRDRSEKRRESSPADLDSTDWYEWEIPFETDPDWPEGLSVAVEAYKSAWAVMMDEVDNCIAANSEQEELVDQPEVASGTLRVSGPFTVEGVRPEALSLEQAGSSEVGGDADPNELQSYDGQNLAAYLNRMVRLLAQDGVTFPNNQHRELLRVDSLYSGAEAAGGVIHAEGMWEGDDPDEPNSIGISFGPQYGPVTAEHVEEAIRSSRRYDELIVAGFSFDAEAQAVLEEASHPRLVVHQAYIRPDANPGMDGLLKETSNSQLFSVFGHPDVELLQDGSEWTCELRGVDVYDPLTSEVRSEQGVNVAAWFLDQDYDGRCFCITQAFFPNQKAWSKLVKGLGSTLEADAFSAFSGTTSLPFSSGLHGRVAVKVVDPRGNEVMTVRSLES